ncbi:transcriptional regulator [Streptomyces sp. MUM 203J]|uniref:helix-turn-helix domain-containing protein n=1 Tax=Streptomyces sp. MUM 203J TaxID=2791990 RepID=UPI001F03EEC2|nr:transcriptional regulator [Streptomyces sp. MUM 203J]MCH0539096.1 transcriptional regulator [Streptomyces sp. MUM 203J]
MNHSRWKTRRTRRLPGERVEESPAHVEAGCAFALGRAVCVRRSEFGLSQSDPARRPGTAEGESSRVEGGDTVPTLPPVTRLAKAPDGSLAAGLDGDTSMFLFTGHDGHETDEAPPGGHFSAA